MELVKVYQTEIEINGKMKRAVVSVKIDHDEPDFQYLEKTEIDELQALLDKGLSRCVYVMVTATFSDLDQYEGYDSLGCVFVRNSYAMEDVLQTVEGYSMVKNACADLVRSVLQGEETLRGFLSA